MDDSMKTLAGVAIAGLAVASSSIAAVWMLRRLRKPQIGFLDVVYDKMVNQLELFVVNDGESPVYVNPSLRLVHFLDPDEWREKNSNGSGGAAADGGGMVAGKSYQVDSVIKGFTLIGECPQAVCVDGKSVRKITYPLSDGVALKVYDNINVDSLYGKNGLTDGRLTNTMRVALKDEVDEFISEPWHQENILPVVHAPEYALEDELAEPAHTADLRILPAVEEKVVIESCLPLQAACVSCGRDSWLHWIVDGRPVCTECKNVIKGVAGQVSPDPVVATVALESSFKEKADAYAALDLKPRQLEILRLLENENNLSVRKIARLLTLTESTVASDLKFLMEKDAVGRIEINRRFLYHLAC
jgi:DNA-binding CsgD family transcriptional regulator